MTSLTIHMGTPPPEGYYIAPTGSDSTGDGSFGNPWATLSKFYGLAVAGDTLNCRDGSYPSMSTLTVSNVGTALAPITVQAYPGETPVLNATETIIQFNHGAAYHVLDGITFSASVASGGGGVLWIGHGTGAAEGPPATGPVTFRNCTITKVPNGDSTAHGIYISWWAKDVLVEDCKVTGDYAETSNNEQAGFHIFHTPGPTGSIARRVIFDNWPNSVLIADTDSDAQIVHCTMVNDRIHIKVDLHSTLLLRDNAGDVAGAANIYDPVDSDHTTADHNFWSQTFDANYYLVAGQTGRGAASDGLDAGALDW